MAKPPASYVLDTGNALYANRTLALPMLEGSGTTTVDKKGGDTATFTGSGIAWGSDAEGPYVVTTDGLSWMNLASNITIPINTSFTLAWGTKGQTSGNNSNMLCGDVTSGGDYWWHHLDSSVAFNTPLTGNTTISNYVSGMVNRNEYVLSFAYSAGNYTLNAYQNGVAFSGNPETIAAGGSPDVINAIMNGYSGSGFAMIGQMYHFDLWVGRALSGAEAATITANPYGEYIAGGDTTPPVVASANVDATGTTLTILFTEAGSPPVLPASSVTGFTLKAGGVTTGTLTATAISSLTYTATTGRTILSGETLTLDYAPGNVTDSAASPNAMLTFSGTSVTNYSTQVGAATSYTLSGPSSGALNVASTNFTVTPNGTYTGTITPHTTGAGTFAPSSLTWSGTSSAKTFTYTPTSIVGSPHSVSTTASPALGSDPAPVSYTVAPAAHAYTSQRAGDWNVPSGTPSSPWYDGGTQSGWNSVPNSGDHDTATVDHAVTATADIGVGAGTAATCLTVQTGTLTVTGAKLTIRGNVTEGQGSHSGNGVARITVASSGSASAGIELDGNSGVTPTLTMLFDDSLVVTGTASHRAYVRTKSGTAGNPAVLTYTASHHSGYAQFSYCDISYLGNSTTPGILALGIESLTTGNASFTMAHCTIDHCGLCPNVAFGGSADGSETISLADSTWTNGLNVDGYSIEVAAANLPITTGTRLVARCRFYDPPILFYVQDFTIEDPYIRDALEGGKNNAQWAAFRGAFIHQTGSAENQLTGDATDCYVFGDPASPSTALNGLYMSAFGDSTVSGCVFETTATVSGTCISQTEGGANGPHTTAAVGNLVLPNGAGDCTGWLFADAQNPPTDLGNYPEAVVEHNTAITGTNGGVIVGITTKAAVAGITQSIRGNLFWSPALHAGDYAVTTSETSPYANVDPVDPANCGHNGFFNEPLVPGGTWTISAPGSNGTHYNLPFSTAPGAGDVVGNPGFVAPTRNLAAWSLHKGGPGTNADAIARVQADPTLTRTDLIPWVRAGFAPTSPAYHNAAHDGTDIGAVAAPATNNPHDIYPVAVYPDAVYPVAVFPEAVRPRAR